MNKIKAGVFILAALLAVNFTKAQTIEDGKKFLYYERYKSARSAFQQLVSANPNNVEAVYWLGQSMIRPEANKDIAGAKALYLKTLETNSNSALLLAGVGHVELLEGKTQDARNHFETAISLSKGKDIAVLNAIGFANGDFDSKSGDAGYAVEKLKQATAIKGFKDPDVYTNLGDAYRKFADGGNALLSYQAALALDPKYARAAYRIGRIYQTQGPSQADIMMQYYNQAISLDANYGPVYYTLFQYNYDINVPKSAEYLDKYLAAMGSDAADQACYLQSSLLYAQGLFQQAIDKATGCITSEGATVNPKLYGQVAYAANRLGDSVKARSYFEQYFNKQKPELIGSGDLITYATILLKFPGNEALAGSYMEKAVALDSTENGKVALLKQVATNYEAKKQYKEAADWYAKILTTKKTPGKIDLYNAGYNYYRANEYQKSIDIFNTYINQYPSESFGYYLNGKNYAKLDSLDVSGNALSNYVAIVNMTDAIKDKPGEKDRIKGSLQYLIEYYANVKSSKDSALYYTDKGIALDPADSNFVNIREQINRMGTRPATPRAPQVTTNSKGEKVTIGTDGTVTTVSKDGKTTSIVSPKGKVTTIKDGITTIVENGKVTTIGKDGKVISTTPTPPKPGNRK